MGNSEETQMNENELVPYLREGLTMKDLVNLKKAFNALDHDSDGKVEYDIKKITDINKYDLALEEEDQNDKVKIDFQTFMKIMTDNILSNRKKFGEGTSYESETTTVLCVICPFKRE